MLPMAGPRLTILGTLDGTAPGMLACMIPGIMDLYGVALGTMAGTPPTTLAIGVRIIFGAGLTHPGGCDIVGTGGLDITGLTAVDGLLESILVDITLEKCTLRGTGIPDIVPVWQKTATLAAVLAWAVDTTAVLPPRAALAVAVPLA